MKQREGEERLDLNNPAWSEERRAAMTEYWNERYSTAPNMNPGRTGDGGQHYIDAAKVQNLDTTRHTGVASGSREALVADAESTRKMSLDAKEVGAQAADDLTREHRAALSNLVNYDRNHDYPIADVSRDLNRTGEMPSHKERETFARQEGLPQPNRNIAYPGQEQWRDDYKSYPDRGPKHEGQKWYEPEQLAEQRVQRQQQQEVEAKGRQAGRAAVDQEVHGEASKQRAPEQEKQQEQVRPQLQSTLARALGGERQPLQQREKTFKAEEEWEHGDTTRLGGHLYEYDGAKSRFIEQRPASRFGFGGSHAHEKTYEQAQAAWSKDRELERGGGRGD